MTDKQTVENIQDAEVLPADEKPPIKEKIAVTKAVVATGKQESLTPYQMRSDGSLALNTIDEQLRFADTLIRQGMISSTFTTPQQVVVAMQWAKTMRMEVMSALRLMYVVDGRPCLWGDGPLMLVQRSGELESIIEFFVDEKGERICSESKNLASPVWGSVTQVWKKGDPRMQEDFFSVEDLKRAGLETTRAGKKKETWLKFERIMMRMKARTMALKSKFANHVNGVPVAEYDHHFSPDMPTESMEVRERSVKSEINDELGGSK